MDEDLLELAKVGDEDAFEKLVGAHRRELYVHCYRMLGSVEDAEDALQESLLSAWRGLSGFEERALGQRRPYLVGGRIHRPGGVR